MRILCLACALATVVSLQLTSLEARGGQANLTVDAAIKNLTDISQQTRWQAAKALREMGSLAEGSVSALARAVESDSDIDVRVQAVLALGAIGKSSPAAVAVLANLVPKRERVVSVVAAIALGDSGPGAKGAVPTIIRYLESSTDAEEIIVSITTLGRIGPSARQAIPSIEKHLEDTQIVPEMGSVAHEARRAIALIQKKDRRDQTESSAA